MLRTASDHSPDAAGCSMYFHKPSQASHSFSPDCMRIHVVWWCLFRLPVEMKTTKPDLPLAYCSRWLINSQRFAQANQVETLKPFGVAFFLPLRRIVSPLSHQNKSDSAAADVCFAQPVTIVQMQQVARCIFTNPVRHHIRVVPIACVFTWFFGVCSDFLSK